MLSRKFEHPRDTTRVGIKTGEQADGKSFVRTCYLHREAPVCEGNGSYDLTYGQAMVEFGRRCRALEHQGYKAGPA